MNRISGLLLFVVFAGSALLAQNQPQAKSATPREVQQRDTGMSREQVRELQGDLERMRSIVEQMQTNMAFVSSGQTPMKHQFELEIQMWQLVIEQMDKKIKQASGREP
jgi:hypothetical protein